MPKADLRATGMDTDVFPGNQVDYALTWPAGFLTGKTWLVTADGTSISHTIVGDVMSFSVSGVTTALWSGQGPKRVNIYETTSGSNQARISGRVHVTTSTTDSPTTAAFTVTTTNSVVVTVTVASGGLDLDDVQALIDAVIGGAPGALDTLNELAAALGDDANFAATVTNLLAAKASAADLTTEATDRANADTALDSRLDVIEALGPLATDAEVAAAIAAQAATDAGTYVSFLQAAMNPDLLIVGAITRDSNDAATSAPVVWPDGTPGTYTADTLSSAFPGAVDGYHVTYGSPATRTYTQPTMTRDSSGAVTNRPAMVIS